MPQPRWRKCSTISAIAPGAPGIPRSVLNGSTKRAIPLKCLRFRGPPTPWLRPKWSGVPRVRANHETQCSSWLPIESPCHHPGSWSPVAHREPREDVECLLCDRSVVLVPPPEGGKGDPWPGADSAGGAARVETDVRGQTGEQMLGHSLNTPKRECIHGRQPDAERSPGKRGEGSSGRGSSEDFHILQVEEVRS